MLSARTIVILLVVVCLISLASVISAAVREPDSDGRGKDSYGTRFYGFRAVYETMQRLKLPVKRSYTPPDRAVRDATTLVLWSPSPTLVTLERQYLRNLRVWVEDGGRLVVGLGRRNAGDFILRTASQSRADIVTELGLPGVTSSLSEQEEIEEAGADVVEDESGDETGDGTEEPEESAPISPQRFRSELRQQVSNIDFAQRLYGEIVEYDLETKGDFPYVAGVEKLALPGRPGVLQGIDKYHPQGVLSLLRAQEELPIAAVFKAGKGEIVLVSDAALLFNICYARADNAVLGVNLLYGEGGGVVFDGFYHGHNIRGNAYWLLTRMPYALIAAALVLAAGIWAWRGAMRLGNPLKISGGTRRSMHEYVAAMSVLFSRADARRHILQEAYEGMLWHIRSGLGLSARSADAAALARVIGRSDPLRAQLLLEAARKAETLLRSKNIHRADAVQVIKEMGECL